MKEGGSRAVLMFWLLLHSSLAEAKWRGRGEETKWKTVLRG